LRASASYGRWKAKRAGWWASPRLNPFFVGWLMGWPEGLALCASSETEFTLWRRRMRGALSALPTASGPWIWIEPATPPATQLSLFEALA